MKKIGFFFFFILGSLGLAYSYQSQGFTNYQEIDGNINFQCDSQCFVLVGDAKLGDYIDIDGSVEGNGIVGYGFLQGQQIIPGGTFEVINSSNIDQRFNFVESQYRTQLPKDIDTQVMLVVQGNIKGTLLVNLGESGPIDKVIQGRNSFWIREKYGYYNINLLYGPKLLGSSFMWIWNKLYLFVFIIFLLYLYLKTNKKDLKKKFIYISILFFAIFGIRFLYDSFGIYKDDLNHFVRKTGNEKMFRNYNDIDSFSNFIKSNVPTGSNILFVSYQERPYPEFAKYQLRPNITVDIFGRTGNINHRIIAVYDIGKFKIDSGNLVDTTNNQIIITGVNITKQYNQFSYILERF